MQFFYIDFEKLTSVRAECAALGANVQTFECDISDEEKVNTVVGKALAHFQKIDILLNNAALWRCMLPFLEMPTDTWRKFFDINVLGTVYVTKAVLPGMVERGYGKVINVASVAGVYGNKNMACYSATKGAIISFTKALAKEMGANGVIVNAISPGTVSSSKDEDIDAVTPNELSYMGRTGSDRENANLICFLASDSAPYISGQNIQIDGCRKRI